MQYLVRKAVATGQSEYQDLDYDAPELSFGSGEDCLVPLALPVGKRVCIKGARKGGASYKADAGLSALIDGSLKSKGTLSPGQVLIVDGYEFSLFDAPMGFDLAVQVQSQEGGTVVAKPRFPMALEDSSFSVRAWGAAGLFLVLALFLVLPVAGLFNENIAETLRKLPTPSDNSWSTGPLIAAHRIPSIGDDCQVCHTKPFQMVQDGQCLVCHRDLTDHIDLNVHKVHDFAEFRCASCHRDHNEPAQIVRTDDALCVGCHDRIDEFDLNNNDAEPARIVTEFSAGGSHPEFRFSMLKPQGLGGALGWQVQRPRLPRSELSESSNLKFPHDLHLDPDKVQLENTGAALGCDSCHQLQDDGQHFAAVTMDKDCRSCHSLTFDVFDPDLELPHGDQRAAVVAMEAHFIREFTDPALRKQRQATKPRRVPGKREGLASCQGTGLDCGRAEALKEAEYQFANTGCVTCHEVVDTGAKNISDRWIIQPVKVTNDWYSKSDFDHSSHLSLAGENEQAVCQSCHQVSSSSLASDISIPEINNCLQCHDTKTHNSVALDCVSCHAFHYPNTSLMSEQKMSVQKAGFNEQ